MYTPVARNIRVSSYKADSYIAASNFEALYIVSNIEAMKKPIYTKENDLLRNWLREKRHAAGLSQRQLSSLLKIHHSIVGKIETGERQINVIELIEYCQILDADPVEIIVQLKLCV